jgi:hypothetical protein
MTKPNEICLCDICGLITECIWDGDLWVCKSGCSGEIYECPECGNTNVDSDDLCQFCIDWLGDPKNDPEPNYNSGCNRAEVS